MKIKIYISLLLLLLILSEGCMTVNLSVSSATKPVLMNNEVGRKYAVVKHVSEELKAYFTFFDVITVKHPEIEKLINRELELNKGDAFINLTITGQTTIVDKAVPIVAGIVGSIVIPAGGFLAASMIGIRTYTVEGDIIQYLDREEPVKISLPILIDPMTGLPIKKEEKKIEYDPETGLPKK